MAVFFDLRLLLGECRGQILLQRTDFWRGSIRLWEKAQRDWRGTWRGRSGYLESAQDLAAHQSISAAA